MNQLEARRYIAAAKGDALIGAWLSILDQHKLPTQTSISPQDWYEAFEELYLCDAIDPDIFNEVDVEKTFCIENSVARQLLDDAMWNLKFLRQMFPGEAIDNMESYMSKKHDGYLPSPEDMESRALSLSPVQERNELAFPADPMGTPMGLSMPPMPELGMNVLEDSAPPLPAMFREPAPSAPKPSLRGEQSGGRLQLRHKSDEPDTSRPYTEFANFTLLCCGEEIELEDTGGGDWYEGDDQEDHDTIDFELHGYCHRCHARFHFGASMPIPKGSLGSGGY